MLKILIATPAYGEIFYAAYVQSVLRLQRLLQRHKWEAGFVTLSYAEISEARNYLVTYWLDKTDASHILFIDADMGFEPQLVLDMLAFDKPIVGAIYPKRQVDLERVAKLAAAGNSAESAVSKAHEFVVSKPDHASAVSGFIKVDGCGAGLLLVRRSCIKTMLERLPELSDEGAKKTSPVAKDLDRLIRAFDPLVIDGARLSEDFSFCYRWRRHCGGEVWANVAHEIVHVGLKRFKARYGDAGAPRTRTIDTPVVLVRRKSSAARQPSDQGSSAGQAQKSVSTPIDLPIKLTRTD
jgi:hypothetical protein